MLYLLVRDGSLEREFVLREGILRVGRLSTNEIVLRSEDVSREHGELRVQGGIVEVRDRGSSTRTSLVRADQGEASPVAAEEWTRMRVGDCLLLGGSARLQLRESLSCAALPVEAAQEPVAGGQLGTLVPHNEAARLLNALARVAAGVATDEDALRLLVENAPDANGALLVRGERGSARIVGWVASSADSGPPPLPLALADETLALGPLDLRWAPGGDGGHSYLAVRAPDSAALVVGLADPLRAPSAEMASAIRLVAALRAPATTDAPEATGSAHAKTGAPRSTEGIAGLFPGVVPSAGFRGLLEQAARVAAGSGPILIAGETGVGKELIARFLHAASGRRGPFVEASVGALSPTLVESELFGHVRGAFTDATRDRPGLLEQAHGGTLFLDEIGEVPLEVQHKLLRSLQERTFRRVGGNETTRFDALVVAATNRDLATEVRAGRFREDLFYRLNMMEVRVPPLRERPGDIAVLADAALRELDPSRSLDVQALDWLIRQPWPGNVRQLRHVLARAVRLHDAAVLRPEHLGAEDGGTPRVQVAGLPLSWRAAQDAFERAWCEMLWIACNGRMREAARLSGLDRSNVRKRLARHGFGTDAEEDDEVSG